MALTREADDHTTARRLGLALATAVPFALYVATASAFGYWHDGGEFVAAAADLGISHPPGHPLAAMVGAFLTMIPIGALPLRVAIAQSLCAAIASGALFLATETTLRAMGVVRQALSVPMALGAAWLTAFGFGFWFQAVRPEVYALNAALFAIAIERIVHLEAVWPTRNMKPLYVAALCTGLALANHHFLAFLVLPVAAPTLARVHGARGFRPVLWSLAAGLLGLASYAYLPLRAAAKPLLNLGAPTDAARLFWVVSAKAFQKNTGGGVPQPLGERFADVIVSLADSLHIGVLLLALVGMYALLRTPGARRIGGVWALVLLCFVTARAYLGFVRGNPDALGYLMPAMAATVVLFVSFLAWVLLIVGHGDRPEPRALSFAVALAVAVLGLGQARTTYARASLANFADTDAYDEVTLRALPPKAVFFAFDPQTLFRFYGMQSAEQSRPDVVMVPMPFLTYPGMVDALIDRDPALTELLRNTLLDDKLLTSDVQSLAALRPVRIELDVRVSQDTMRGLVPEALSYAALTSDAVSEDRKPAKKSYDTAWATLHRLLHDQGQDPARVDDETRNRTLWRLYMDALYFAAVGERDAARQTIVRAMTINPEAKELLGLDEALETTPGKGPIDVTPFLPTATP